MTDIIRPACDADAAALPELERTSGEVFRGIPDLAWIADDDVMPAEAHLAAIRDGTCWVAADATGIAGFLTARAAVEDGTGPDSGRPVLHVWQMAVAPGRQRRGLGRRLLDHAAAHAARHAFASLTLTTFRDVPWNGPFYARTGYDLLADAALTPRLRAILKQEAAHGLPPARRCAMRRTLPSCAMRQILPNS
ncbi:GCN5-related N-acetyltransferase [Gluconacetobacter diazotrophicus PA1 5]|uniref:Putative acetyltransferase n=1 Tax=Gluconacetobacter diazotrophicus (strain ATCC 49037 / DSM 5601 / CCUG 37298 / CIP 103539 / LMG 7603 / PAl5) TaxID=272568 RepID=A9H9N5_GLUDA|nr:GNAT family N-acetyltransferase [Gluconacetobacter diazotrophicus]ACI52403.1 GCN5-related N-acetyltransferase [Gluconacetobacter diazotrophicus PA1 5]TWA98205.1 acetyltransferase (GNAT) family protein [Gluconacetobacter diazotrophicus]CAP57732.1 putative acetyltransferase [Gluconacetobacter diazotrophicus PA1 5]